MARSLYSIEKQLKENFPDIQIVGDTYVNTNTKCTFIDAEYGPWQATPANVLRGKGHPTKGRKKCDASRARSPEDVERQIQEKYPHLTIKKETYVDIKTKCTIMDSEYGEFISSPLNVIYSGTQHKSRKRLKFLDKMARPIDSVKAELQEKSPDIEIVDSSYTNTNAHAVFIDKKYGEWVSTPINVLRGRRHPSHKSSGSSRGEVELREYIESLQLEVKSNLKFKYSSKNFYEVDVFVPQKNIGIEYHGLFWHSEQKKDKRYHSNKFEFLREKGISLIQIYENEWHNQKEIVKSIIKAKLGLSTRNLHARKLKVLNVGKEQAQEFLRNNHLMGEFKSAKHIGLFDGNELVSLMSYKKYKDGVDISRFCNKIDHSVAGGLSKLLKEIERRESPKFIQSFVDLRYGTGESLTKIGFTLESTTLGWKWTNHKDTFNRLQCRANMDERKLTEKEYAVEKKWSKIYDAGQAKFRKML